MEPDPYRDWLAIKSDQRVPNHYELLGVALFSADTAEVRQAYEDRYTTIRRYEVGKYGDRASALMAELSDAFKCLTNDKQRSQYDQSLRESLSARETSADARGLQDTLVEPIVEFEEIVDAPESDDDPLREALDDASGLVPTQGESSQLSSSATRLPKEAASKREVAIPIWLAAVGAGGVLLLAGAILVAFMVLASRDDQGSGTVAQPTPLVDGQVEDGEPAPEISNDAIAGVAWSGRLARVLVDGEGALHLLVDSPERIFEATSKDPILIQQLAGSICAAEDVNLADLVKLTGTVLEDTPGFFETARLLQNEAGDLTDVQPSAVQLPVIDLQSLDLEANSGRSDTALTVEEMQTLSSLRTVDRYTQFVATVSKLFQGVSRSMEVSFCGRNFYVEIPAAWQAAGLEVSPGQLVTLVSRTTGVYASPAGVAGSDDKLLLEVETINQPSFQQVVQSPALFADQSLVYQANLRSTTFKDNSALLSLDLQNAGKEFIIKGSAELAAGQDTLLESFDGRDPVLVELQVAKDRYQLTYEVIALTQLNDSAKRIEFAAVAPVKPEPVLTQEDSPPKAEPPTELTLAKLPDHVDLPSVSSTAPKILTRAPDVAELEIDFDGELMALDDAYGFVAKQDSAQTLRWEIYLRKTLTVGNQELVVAQLAVEDQHFVFQWTEDAARLSAGQLRNCVARLKSGAESHDIALRSPLEAAARRLPTAEDKFQITFDLEDLPDPAMLHLDVDVSYQSSSIASPSKKNTTTRGKRLDFKLNTPADVEIQVALLPQEDKSLILQAVPRHKLSANRQLALCVEEVDEYEERIQQSGLRAERSLLKAQNMLQTASSAYSRARDSATRVKFNKIMQTQSKAIAVNQENIVDMQRTLSSIGQLRNLVETVNWGTMLRYQIYAEAEGTRLLLVDAGYRDRGPIQQDAIAGAGGEAAGLDGLWQPIRIEFQGRQIPMSPGMRMRLAGGRFTIENGSSVTQYTYQIDDSSTPPRITFDEVSLSAARRVGVYQQSGVYQLSGNRAELSIAFSFSGPQPRGLESTGTVIVAVYRRVE